MTALRSSVTSPKAALARLGLSPRKGLGQHFLVSRGVLTRILEAAEIGQGDTVVEVGPGLGVLTGELVRRAGRVVAVEADQALARALEAEMTAWENLRVVCADAREVAVEDLVGDAGYKLVANLPYFAASPILRRFLESSRPPTRVVVMMQREVAKSMSAKPGDMSLMSVGVQLYGHARIVGYVRPSSFYPPPKVTSAIVRIDVYPKPVLELDDREAFFRLVRAGFSAPRKQLRNSLSQGLDAPSSEVDALLMRAGVDARRRAETLSMDEWGTLYGSYREAE